MLRFCLTALLVAVIAPTASLAESCVYVSVAGENRIAVYGRDARGGGLTHQSNVSINGEPGALTVDPQRRFLFASIRSEGNLASFRLDPRTGQLHLLSEVVAGDDPAYVFVDHSGKFLLSAYYRAAKVTVHRILANGAIAHPPVQEVATAINAHAIVTDRSNRFAFVPHTGPNAIFQFRFNPGTGLLEPGGVPKVQRPEQTGPRHLVFHPIKDFAYVSDEQGNSVSVYRFAAQNGAHTPLQTESTLPAGFSGRNSTARLEVHPSGRFVYVANRGHDSLAGFQIDQTTGLVTSFGQTPTEGTPRSFSISPSGDHLYAAGQATGRLAAFNVDTASGSLSRFATYVVGERPWWVLVVDTLKE
jgi:6-phosphogluconolactonase